MATPESQLHLTVKIKNVIDTLKKDGIERKTNQAIEKAINEVNIVWQIFMQGHNHKDLLHNETYIKAKIMEETKERYDSLINQVKQLGLKRAEEQTGPVSSIDQPGVSQIGGERRLDDPLDDKWQLGAEQNAYIGQLIRELSRHCYIQKSVIDGVIADPTSHRSEATCLRLIQ